METQAEQEQAERPRRAGDREQQHALAASVPDDNHILMRMIKLLLNSKMALITTPLAGLIMLVYVIAKWGVPAILATQTLILQLYGDGKASAEQAAKQEAADKAAADQILQGIRGIDGKVTKLGADVEQLQAKQVAADKRIAAVAAEQRKQPKP